MTNLLHTITYTQYSAAMRAHVENHATLWRNRRLTVVGAQRILRREGYTDAIVTQLETIINNR